MEMSEQINMVSLDACSNKLSGKLPEGISNLLDLQFLDLGDNFFYGLIPPSFTSLKNLVYLDLSNNTLSGPIPQYFSACPLTYLNLSYNNFVGSVPTTGVFANTSAVSLIGNRRLCGGVPELHLPRCEEEGGKRKRTMHFSHKLIILIVLCALGGILTMATCIWLYLKLRPRRTKGSTAQGSLMDEQFLKVSYNMLLKATNGFSQTNLLGSGTFGSVFKGILDGNTVAVKVFDLQHGGASKSFMVECMALRNIRHRNLVGIITACSSIDNQRSEFKALVYEYMSNGSLDRWLHEGRQRLSLLQRVNIAIDVAHALNYLHNECDNPIVHCDLKPSNILLDDDLVAHVGDFGLVKVLAQPQHPNQSSSIGVKGTFGYVAPEYGLGGEASVEVDLYSYGILLLELITRKRPTDEMFKEELNLHIYAKTFLPDKVLQVVDSQLLDFESQESKHMIPIIKETLQVVVTIGVACSNALPHGRMKISDAICELQNARNNLLKY